jgi:hypothetical protein
MLTLLFRFQQFFLKDHSWLLPLLVLLLSTACGGGGDNNDEPTTPPSDPDPVDTQGHYYFYTGSLVAVDPANPESPVSVEAGDDIVEGASGYLLSVYTFMRGDYNNLTKIISEYGPDTLLYAKTDGRLYKIPAQQGASLTPVPVSSEQEADQICVEVGETIVYPGITTADDLSNRDQSQFVYSLPGDDNSCDTIQDNIWKMVRVGMDSSEAPIAAYQPVLALKDLDNDASIQHWLVNDSSELKRCDATFAQCGEVIGQAANEVYGVFDLGLHHHLLQIDNQLVIYNIDSNTLSRPIFTIPQGTFVSSFAVDEHNIFFANATSIYRAPIDGSEEASEIGVETTVTQQPVPPASNLIALNDKLIYVKAAHATGGDAEIRVLDKTGGTPDTLVTAEGAEQGFIFTQGERIYYYFEASDSMASGRSRYLPRLAGIMDELGTKQMEVSNAAWIGWSQSRKLSAVKDSAQAWIRDKLILGEYNPSDQDISGMTLKSFDGATGSELATLGNVPDLEELLRFSCQSGYDSDLLCEARLRITPEPAHPEPFYQNDIYYLDAMTNGSITRVTDTPDKSEFLLKF